MCAEGRCGSRLFKVSSARAERSVRERLLSPNLFRNAIVSCLCVLLPLGLLVNFATHLALLVEDVSIGFDTAGKIFSLDYAACHDVSITVNNEIHLASEANNGSLVVERKIQLTGEYPLPTRPLVYDPRHDFLYVSGTIKYNATTMHRIHIRTGELQTIAITDPSEPENANKRILGIEHDYVGNILYWTNGRGGEILKLDLNTSPMQQNILYHSDISGISIGGLALDECNQTLFWTSYVLGEDKGFIESLKLTLNEHKRIYMDLHHPSDLTIDHAAKKLYWCDVRSELSYKIERSNLDGSFREVVIEGHEVQPLSLALTAQYVYWINTEHFERTEKVTKNTNQRTVLDYEADQPKSLVSYKAIQHCVHNDARPEIKSHPSNSSMDVGAKDDKEQDSGRIEYTVVSNDGVCLNGGEYIENNDPLTLHQDVKCKCPQNFYGQFCEKCDYCVNGKCTVSSNKSITCMCDKGYNGTRCERDVCFNYCLNGGQCNIGNQSEPTCDCTTAVRDYHGSRCEIDCNLFCQNNPTSGIYDSGKPICACVRGLVVKTMNMENVSMSQLADELHSNTEMQLRFGLIGVGGLCIIFLIAIVCLIKSVFKLRKRPRIKKRIIVNKNITPTPLTCRPSPVAEQCEITIENCCNMNICETPCYEPQLRTSDKSVSKTEEKKNLLGNMEEAESGSPSQDTLY